MDNRCSSCPLEIVWESIDSDTLLRHPKILSIDFRQSNKVRLPPHLEQETVREFSVMIRFAADSTLNDVDAYIRRVGHYAFEGNTQDTCWGTVYRRSEKKGYWALHAPCIYCYGDLLDNGAPEDMLRRAVIISSIF